MHLYFANTLYLDIEHTMSEIKKGEDNNIHILFKDGKRLALDISTHPKVQEMAANKNVNTKNMLKDVTGWAFNYISQRLFGFHIDEQSGRLVPNEPGDICNLDGYINTLVPVEPTSSQAVPAKAVSKIQLTGGKKTTKKSSKKTTSKR